MFIQEGQRQHGHPVPLVGRYTAPCVLEVGKDSGWPLFLGEIGSLLLLWRLLVWVRAEPSPVSLSKYASSIWLNELWLLINGSYLAEVLLNCQDLKLA